ncbi:class I SAM-dependent methyltransferase [Dactylosporangium fulvum]|uniref:Class I SAM-dependent methyltransferase n=1 Tax=Dactylosporangium fulvum TaxID=53359 RepID=A0ABY5VW57_9ACTN|nr:class I SAM-dependent methyltransferase [Dactylosporangium fulvum]UWP81410.1 class I SAM-dependent methyltransferase [Dactylosporangium fulvum]
MNERWTEVLQFLAGVVPPGPATVVVDGTDAQTTAVADRLTDALRAAGRPCHRVPGSTSGGALDAASSSGGAVAVADGPEWRARPPRGGWRVVVWLRTSRHRHAADGSRGESADVVVDLQDPEWPVVRHVDTRLADVHRWYVTESRAFFGAKAATWDAKFGADLPAYAAAVERAGLPEGGTVADVGCGTGRALPALRAAVGPAGAVLGIDLTPQMLAVAREPARAAGAALVLGDARRLPLAAATVDAVFAAGLVMHLPDPDAGLRELARVTRPAGRLVLFHPSGRAALAARQGRVLRPDEPLAEGPLAGATGRAGWELIRYEDAPGHFFALATRR